MGVPLCVTVLNVVVVFLSLKVTVTSIAPIVTGVKLIFGGHLQN
jgi:hypothetical protein